MLFLSRRVGERIMVGDNIVVQVMSVDKGQVRIGIDAPRDVAVHREEVALRIAKEEQKKGIGKSFDDFGERNFNR